jgi:hypothetical protein
LKIAALAQTLYRPPMSLSSLRGVLALGALGVLGLVGAACSGTGGTTIETTGNGNGNGSSGGAQLGGPSPITLVSQCDTICNNVVAECAGESDAPVGTCLDACGDLGDLTIIQNTCLNPFATYIACVAGNSIQCSENGQAVLISPPSCIAQREAALNCNAQPGIVSACIGLPGNTSCGPNQAEGQPVFCVGAPANCQSPEPNPLGIGIYCCPD